MNRQLTILAPVRYPWRFNGPRNSRHCIETRRFLPLNYVSPRIEGVTIFEPLPPRRFDLVHAFNRIPLGGAPFVIGFESHLPRAFGSEGGACWRWMTRRLEDERCRAIVAMSRFAQRIFLARHGARPDLARKLHVRYPNIALPEARMPVEQMPDGPIRLVFVGNHFARKGGCVAVRMVDLAAARGIRVEVDIVSRLEMGARVWSDPVDQTAFAPYRALLARPNVRVHAGLPNAEVRALLRRAHFGLLPTFSDTFGYSVLESMAEATPVIATRQGALPELIADGEDGILLDLPVNDQGEWRALGSQARGSAAFLRTWHEEIHRLAEQGLARMIAVAADPTALAAMRARARQSVRRFDAMEANAYWDALYDRAVEGVVAAAE